ncbi:MAG: hypothetical protein ACQ5SW_10495 [Sphaerochaetaceae bacterium]
MNDILGLLVSVVIALLAGLGALQKRKLNKARSKAEEAEQKARKAELKLKISETATKAKDEILSGQKELQKQKESVDQKITENSGKEDPDEKRQEQQEIVNYITDFFNSRAK